MHEQRNEGILPRVRPSLSKFQLTRADEEDVRFREGLLPLRGGKLFHVDPAKQELCLLWKSLELHQRVVSLRCNHDDFCFARRGAKADSGVIDRCRRKSAICEYVRQNFSRLPSKVRVVLLTNHR